MLGFGTLFILFVLGAIGLFIYKAYIWPYYVSPLRKLPGPPSDNPLFGNLGSILTEEAGEPLLRWVNKYGSITKFYGILNEPNVLITDSKIIQQITTTKAYEFIKVPNSRAAAIAGNGLVLAEGENHKRQRKMMNPAFSISSIKDMIPSFLRITSTLKKLIENEVSAGETNVNFSSYLSKATLDIIGIVGFSYEFNSLTSSNRLAEAYEYLMTPSRSILSFIMGFLPFLSILPLDINKRFEEARKIVESESKGLIEKKYLEDKNNKLNGKDLLSLLIKINKTLPAEEKMTDDELKYQIMTFLIAGHVTTSMSTGWALYMLAKHPHCQDLLREELVKAFPDKSKFEPTFDEINSLEYLNCVFKETLRLYTPSVASRRLTTKDNFFDGYFIPKNTVVNIAVTALHRSPSVWGPTADDFDPKRWLDPSLIKEVNHLNYLPFSTGARTCIGSKLATIEFKILLSMIIRNFVIKPVEGLNIKKRYTPVTAPDPYVELMVSKVEN